MIECLLRKHRRVHRILLDSGARNDEKVDRLLELAQAEGVPVSRVARARLDKLADGRVHNGVIAEVDPLTQWTTLARLDAAFTMGHDPFFVLADTVQYEHNLGAILRTSLGFGVDAVVVPTRRGAQMSPVVARVSMGAVEAVPVIREGLHSALKHIKKAGVRVVGADMNGTPLGQARLAGPLALVMGGESKGLSSSLAERCDEIVSVPLAGGLESLNVSVAASIIMYEKRRQDGWGSGES